MEGEDEADTFATLLAAGQQGEQWAFDQMYRRYGPLLVRFIRNRVPGEEAEDVAMEAWASILRDGGGLTRFDGKEEAFVGWLVTVARRRIVDHQRRWARRPHATEPVERADQAAADDGSQDPAEVVGTALTTQEALETLRSELTPRQFHVVCLRVVGDFKAAEIARRMDLSVTTVRVELHRALKRLAVRLATGVGDR